MRSARATNALRYPGVPDRLAASRPLARPRRPGPSRASGADRGARGGDAAPRLDRAREAERQRHGWCGCGRVEAPRASQDSLRAVHPERHIRFIDELSAMGGGHVDMDTVAVPATYEAALHAAGGGIALVDALLSGEAATGFSALRPPGHHAEPSRAMGFCFFGNAGIAARHAASAHGVERVLILDWDVHHGNGTNEIFRADPGVLF